MPYIHPLLSDLQECWVSQHHRAVHGCCQPVGVAA